MKLPAPVQIFFDAETTADAVPLDAFAPDAVVKDEGGTHAGHAAIAGWWRAAKAQYQHTAEPCELLEQPGLTVVRARVSGRFPGSPAVLTFTFRLQDGQPGDSRIAALEIGS